MLLYIQTFLQKHWFLSGILSCIAAAHTYPPLGATGGPLYPEVTVKFIGVALIFFNSGLSLNTDELARAIVQWKLHTYIQGFTFIFTPLVFCVVSHLLHSTTVDPWLINGYLAVGCMPPPVSSGVILTKAVGGNEAAAIFNSAFGSFLGIFVTPLLLLGFLGSSSSVNLSTIVGQLTGTVLIPIVMGQMLRTVLKENLDRWKIPYGTISSIILLLIIYTTFCDTFSHKEMAVDEIGLVFVILLVLVSQCTLLVVTFWLSTRPRLKFAPRDVVAALFCSTHKSLTLGIPLLTVIFADDPQLSGLTLPLLVYHPTQILLGGVLVPAIRAWVQTTPLPSYRPFGYLQYV